MKIEEGLSYLQSGNEKTFELVSWSFLNYMFVRLEFSEMWMVCIKPCLNFILSLF